MAHTGYVMTLANSIIGVGILAMPFCFQKCGIILSIVLLVLSSLLTRLSCHYLLKSALLTRKRSFEFLALYVFGPSGKLMVELCIIGYLVGTCIAYFVVIGDLGPQIVAKILNIMATESLRTWVMFVVTFLCIIPLGLLKNVDSLSAVCTASVGFYFCMVVKVMFEAQTHILNADWMQHVDLWKPSGILQCLPIFSMALSCQMQLFEVVESVNGATVEKLNEIVRMATSICTCVYIFVGFFGYVAFCTQTFSGNILVNFSPSFASDAIKIGFVLSVAFSFPLSIFPCRASIYSLLYRRGHADSTAYIPEIRFRWITIAIILMALFIGLLIPSIELVIGLVGSTIGVAICVMFPAACFIKVFKKDSTEKNLAQFVLVCGFCFMILGTYANLSAIDEKRSVGPIIEGTQAALTPEPFRAENMKPKEEFKSILKTLAPEIVPNIETKNAKEEVIEQRIDPMPKAPKEEIIESKGEIPIAKLDPSPMLPKELPNEKPQLKEEESAKHRKENVKSRKAEKEDVKEVVSQPSKKPKEISNEINKDAIKKEEEMAAEEEKRPEEKQPEKKQEIQQTKEEWKETKELLEKKVNELQEELAKQNYETQQLVQEKLGVIAEKVVEIERKVNQEVNGNKLEDKKESIKKDQVLEEKDKIPIENNIVDSLDHKQLTNNNDNIPNAPKTGKDTNNEAKNVPLTSNNISESDPIIMLLSDKLKKTQPNSNVVQKTEPKSNVVYEPMSYKVGEVMNQESRVEVEITKNKTKPIPLPLLLDTTLHKQAASLNTAPHKSSSNDNKADGRKPFDEKPLSAVEDNVQQREKAPEESAKENIESIRRDILEVGPNRDDPTSALPQANLNILREKREAREFCVNWDLEKSYCRDDNVKNELLSQNNPAMIGNDVKLQPFGRDLKSVNDEDPEKQQ